MAKILIIHPKDASTADFEQTYNGLGNTTVIKSHNKNRVRLALRDTSAKIVIFCGHGSADGLLNPSATFSNNLFERGNKRFLFDVSMLYLLRNKIVLFFWCYAKTFAQKYSLKGFASGMFISDMNECSECCVNATGVQLDESNRLISEAIREFVTHPQVETIDALAFILEHYKANNPIVEFNRHEMK